MHASWLSALLSLVLATQPITIPMEDIELEATTETTDMVDTEVDTMDTVVDTVEDIEDMVDTKDMVDTTVTVVDTEEDTEETKDINLNSKRYKKAKLYIPYHCLYILDIFY